MSSKKAKRLQALEAKVKRKAQGDVGVKRRGGEIERVGGASRGHAPAVGERKKRQRELGGEAERGLCAGSVRSESKQVGSLGERGGPGDARSTGRGQAGEPGESVGGEHPGHQRVQEGKTNNEQGTTLSALLYTRFEDVVEVFPWLEGAGCGEGRRAALTSGVRSVNDVVRSLLQTNHRYNAPSAASSSGIVDKMKEKTLLLENPVGQKASRNNRRGMFYAPPGVRMASRNVLKGLDGAECSYEDALVLHGLWRGYRDGVMGEPTASKQEEMERIWGLERCGAMVEVVWPSELVEEAGSGSRGATKGGEGRAKTMMRRIKGIVIKDSAKTMHVVEEGGKVRVVDKSSGCVVSMEVQHGRVAQFV